MLADDLVRDGAARERHLVHAAPRGFHGLAHRFADFIRLAGRDPDLTFSIPHRNQCVEGETATTLHDLRDAIDRDDVLDHAVAFATAAVAVTPVTTAAPTPAAAAARSARTAAAAAAPAAPAAAWRTALFCCRRRRDVRSRNGRRRFRAYFRICH